jgi:hypothetical protein
MSTKTSTSLYLLLVRDPADGHPEPTDAQYDKLFAWFRDLKERGHLVAVHPLDKPTAKVLRGAGQVTDGPFIESKEVVGGYVLVAAKNRTQAVALAKGFPMFAARRSVEVRRVDPVSDAEIQDWTKRKRR